MTAILAFDLFPDADPEAAVAALRETVRVTSVEAAPGALVALVEAETPAAMATAAARFATRPEVSGAVPAAA